MLFHTAVALNLTLYTVCNCCFAVNMNYSVSSKHHILHFKYRLLITSHTFHFYCVDYYTYVIQWKLATCVPVFHFKCCGKATQFFPIRELLSNGGLFLV